MSEKETTEALGARIKTEFKSRLPKWIINIIVILMAFTGGSVANAAGVYTLIPGRVDALESNYATTAADIAEMKKAINSIAVSFGELVAELKGAKVIDR